MKTVKRKRVNPVKVLRLAVVTLLLVIIMIFTVKTSASGSPKVRFVEVTVCPGDTLWDISREYTRGENIEKVIYDIKKINKMQKSDIYPGQTLKIPLKN